MQARDGRVQAVIGGVGGSVGVDSTSIWVSEHLVQVVGELHSRQLGRSGQVVEGVCCGDSVDWVRRRRRVSRRSCLLDFFDDFGVIDLLFGCFSFICWS